MYREIRNFLSYEIVLSVFDVILNTDYNFCPGPDCPVALSPGPNPGDLRARDRHPDKTRDNRPSLFNIHNIHGFLKFR